MTFTQAYNCLILRGPAIIHTLSGTTYTVEARLLDRGERTGERVIIAKPRSGSIYIHADCWRQEVTCQGTRASLYAGADGLLAWLNVHSAP